MKLSSGVELRNLTKTYPGVRALTDVSLTLRPGTVTALAGENGAGKSTFIKILAGAQAPDSGTVVLDGVELPSDPKQVIDAGISVIYQELTDVPDMSIVDNLVLGRPENSFGLTHKSTNLALAKQVLARVGMAHVDVNQPIRSLSPAQRQLVEIARCLARNAKVLVFDEPTSSLPEKDVENLLALITRLRETGLAILYVSHHLDELFAIADAVCVLRDGKLVANGPISEWTEEKLVHTMLAKSLERVYPYERRAIGSQRLAVSGLVASGVKSATITAGAGEIVGLVGLAGAGRTELLKAIAGINVTGEGTVEVDSRPVKSSSITAARQHGIVYAPEDRKHEGLILEATIQDNMLYGLYHKASRFGWRLSKQQRAFAQASMASYRVKADSPLQRVGNLSGGNQQKVVLARAAACEPKVVLLDDPTRGVDVGAKSGIYEQVLGLASEGVTILLTSSDTDEVLAMADRIYVLRSGRIVGEMSRDEFARDQVLHLAAAG